MSNHAESKPASDGDRHAKGDHTSQSGHRSSVLDAGSRSVRGDLASAPSGGQRTELQNSDTRPSPPPNVVSEQSGLVVLDANGKISLTKKTTTVTEGEHRHTVERPFSPAEQASAQKEIDALRRDRFGEQDAPSSSGTKFSNPLGDTKYGDGRGATGAGGHGLDQDANTKQWESRSAQDMMAPAGAPVRAATAGTILWITLDQRDQHTGKVFGDQVTIKSDDGQLKTFYTHIELDPEIRAKWQENPGRQDLHVGRGQVLGHVTTWQDAPTGTHLHFGVASRRSDGTYKGIDPVPLLNQTKGSTEAHDVTVSDDGGYAVGKAQAGTAVSVAPVEPPSGKDQRPPDEDCVHPSSSQFRRTDN